MRFLFEHNKHFYVANYHANAESLIYVIFENMLKTALKVNQQVNHDLIYVERKTNSTLYLCLGYKKPYTIAYFDLGIYQHTQLLYFFQ